MQHTAARVHYADTVRARPAYSRLRQLSARARCLGQEHRDLLLQGECSCVDEERTLCFDLVASRPQTELFLFVVFEGAGGPAAMRRFLGGQQAE